MDAVILSATSMSYIPEKYWDDFLSGVGQAKSWKFDDSLGYFWIKCSSVNDFNGVWLELDEQFVYIAPENFIQRVDGECWLFVDYYDDDYMWLGQSFLEGNYWTFTVFTKKVGVDKPDKVKTGKLGLLGLLAICCICCCIICVCIPLCICCCVVSTLKRIFCPCLVSSSRSGVRGF